MPLPDDPRPLAPPPPPGYGAPEPPTALPPPPLGYGVSAQGDPPAMPPSPPGYGVPAGAPTLAPPAGYGTPAPAPLVVTAPRAGRRRVWPLVAAVLLAVLAIGAFVAFGGLRAVDPTLAELDRHIPAAARALGCVARPDDGFSTTLGIVALASCERGDISFTFYLYESVERLERGHDLDVSIYYYGTEETGPTQRDFGSCVDLAWPAERPHPLPPATPRGRVFCSIGNLSSSIQWYDAPSLVSGSISDYEARFSDRQVPPADLARVWLMEMQILP